MECLGYLAFTRQSASLKSVSLGRGNDWGTQQGLLRQIKAIDSGVSIQHAVLRRRCVNSSLISAPRRACSAFLSPPCRMSGFTD